MTNKTTKPIGPFVLMTFEGDNFLFDERGLVMMNGKPKQTNVARLYFEKDLGEHKAKYWTLNIDEAQKFGTMDEATAQLCKLKNPHLIKVRKLQELQQMTNNKITDKRTIGARISALLVADSVPLSDAWGRLIDDAEKMESELQERRKADSDGMSAGNYCYHYKAEGENGCYAGVANVSDQVVDWNTFQAFKITVGRLNGDKITGITSLSFLGEVNKS
ncbi:hypothetical protein [Salmonella enterica]|uniref:hypothetical protein n=1 Tax=Salmonella enterica TaxID=28901 RepID=UPI0003BD6DCC|nr:hypothetical protein [Salmonella enterica]